LKTGLAAVVEKPLVVVSGKFLKIHTSAITLSQFQELVTTIARKMT